jgi:hypothetical protein
MKTSGSIDLGCGNYSYSIGQKDAKTTCRHHPLQAPRGDNESDGATSLDAAIVQFCTDNNFKVVNKGDNVYQRYGITELGVADRSSFWLRGAITCGNQEKMIKDDCIRALNNGMKECDTDNGYTHGLTASLGCLDYSIDLSGATHDDSPPWDEKPSYPPPELLAKEGGGGPNKVHCLNADTRPLIDEDFEKSIDGFCQNGAEIKGYGQHSEFMYRYPPQNQPQFYSEASDTMFFTSGSILNDKYVDGDRRKGFVSTNDPNWKPYEDMRWCR